MILIPEKRFGLILTALFVLELSGCAIGLYQYPATFEKYDEAASYTPLQPSEVYFFLSKEAFPPGMKSVQVGYIFTPLNTDWNYDQILKEFETKAAAVGANAIVFEKLEVREEDMGYRVYKGRAMGYRLFNQSASEDVDLSTSEYGTRTPDFHKIQ